VPANRGEVYGRRHTTFINNITVNATTNANANDIANTVERKVAAASRSRPAETPLRGPCAPR
jgi:hypothetical protein